jgi:cation:H+ antiporter
VLLAVLLVVVGAVLLTAGAEAFAENVTAAATGLGVSVLALAVLLAGAEPEEAITAMVAAGQGHPALAAGYAVGANLVILTLTVGLAALVVGLPISRRVLQYAGAAVLLGALAVLLLWNGVLGRGEGVLLVLVYAVGVAWVWRRERTPPVIGEMAENELEGVQPVPEDSGRPLLFVLLGLVGMVVGGFVAVLGAERLVDVLNVQESVIGLTVLALATSAEMVALVWAARRNGVKEVIVAGAIGAVGYNATVTLGLAGIVHPLVLGLRSQAAEVGVLTAVLPLVLFAGHRSGRLPRWLGVPLLACYAGVVWWLFAS